MSPAPPLMTIDEYFQTPERLSPMELIYGSVRAADAPLPRHQSAVAQLFRALDEHVRRRDLGRIWLAPLDVVLDPIDALVVQPDLLFISKERSWIVQDRVRGAPDLVIEVLSPQPRIGKTQERVGWFADRGVRECWLVHQDRRDITVITFANRKIATRTVFQADVPIRSLVLPDFSASFAELLAGA